MIEKQVRDLIEGPIQEMGIDVDNVEYVKEGSNYFLRITIDRAQPIDVDTCEEVTHVVNPILDEADIIKDSYILDISSKEKGD